MLIDVQPFPRPSQRRAQAPCTVEAHFYRVHPASENLLKPILFCPVCEWTFEEIATDRELCTHKWTAELAEGMTTIPIPCHAQRVNGTAYCNDHQPGKEKGTK